MQALEYRIQVILRQPLFKLVVNGKFLARHLK